MSWGKQKARHTSETAGTTIQQTPVKTCLSLPINSRICSSTALHLSLSIKRRRYHLNTTLPRRYIIYIYYYVLFFTVSSSLSRFSLSLSLYLLHVLRRKPVSIFSSFLKRCRCCFILTHSFIFRMIQWFN